MGGRTVLSGKRCICITPLSGKGYIKIQKRKLSTSNSNRDGKEELFTLGRKELDNRSTLNRFEAKVDAYIEVKNHQLVSSFINLGVDYEENKRKFLKELSPNLEKIKILIDENWDKDPSTCQVLIEEFCIKIEEEFFEELLKVVDEKKKCGL